MLKRWTLMIVGLSVLYGAGLPENRFYYENFRLSSYRGAGITSITEARQGLHIRHPGLNDFLRKTFVMTVGTFNSEVLFANLGATKIDGYFITLIYGAPFVIMDEMIQKYDLDNLSVFYLGSIFGLILEDVYVNTVQESPLYFMTFITTFWHGGITTWSAFTLADQFFPRTPNKPYNRPVLWTAYGTMGVMGGLMALGYTIPTFQENIVTHLSVLTLIGGYTYLIRKNIEKRKKYVNRPLLGLGMIGVGYALGNWIHSLDEEKPPSEQENILSPKDWDLRARFYGILAAASITKMVVDHKQPNNSLSVTPRIFQVTNGARVYQVRLSYRF